ncbi:hypothetical protein TNCV_3548381 [Trichonephila clavipes]|nr:hypothetical protein TNCV_3548381 [Trichonephila clavipes]
MAIGARRHNFEPWSSDEDTRPKTHFPTTPPRPRDRFNVHQPLLLGGTRLELTIRLPRIRYLDHSATTATFREMTPGLEPTTRRPQRLATAAPGDLDP